MVPIFFPGIQKEISEAILVIFSDLAILWFTEFLINYCEFLTLFLYNFTFLYYLEKQNYAEVTANNVANSQFQTTQLNIDLKKSTGYGQLTDRDCVNYNMEIVKRAVRTEA